MTSEAVDMLIRCRNQFKFYAAQHQRKLVRDLSVQARIDTVRKAETNLALAAEIDAFLSKTVGSPDNNTEGNYRMAEKDRLKQLADAFQALTHREMKTLAEVLVDTIAATNGLQIKPAVMADVLDAFGAYLEIEQEKQ